ncbi:hypothetical protein [Comamonas sp. lk]|uniref:hypothetical protein n=1 Tax=Comamonas sp. lk TaxID=2201272 RepID=UPI000EB4172D|nr:hypothetical protein [Comamonas sp. lk]
MNKNHSEDVLRAIEPVMNRMEERHWAAGKPEGYGGAGAALAIALVVMQIKLDDGWRTASLAFSALSIPIWIGIAQISSLREMWNVNHKEHPALSKNVVSTSGFFVVAALMLFTAVCCLLASFSTLIAALFLVFGAVVSAFVMRYLLQVQRVLFNHR